MKQYNFIYRNKIVFVEAYTYVEAITKAQKEFNLIDQDEII